MSKYSHDVACGFIPGRQNINVFGFLDNIQKTDLPSTLWLAKGLLQYAATGETWEIVSDSSADALSGNGGQMVALDLLDVNYNQIPVVMTLNGTVPVTLPGNTNFRVNGMTVIQSGSNGVNVGNITLRVSGGGPRRGQIIPGIGTMNACSYTTPAGHVATFDNALYVQAKPGGAIGTWQHQFIVTFPNGSFVIASRVVFSINPIPITIPSTFPIPPKVRFEVRCIDVSEPGLFISAQQTGILTNLSDPSVTNRIPSAFTTY